MASRLMKMLESATEADLEEIEAEIAKDVETFNVAIERKKRIRDSLMAALGIPIAPNRVRSGGTSVTSEYRERILEYLACTDEPISGYKICTDLDIPTGSQTFVMSCELFERRDKRYVLSGKGRESAGLNGHEMNGK